MYGLMLLIIEHAELSLGIMLSTWQLQFIESFICIPRNFILDMVVIGRLLQTIFISVVYLFLVLN
jgi:hypothetical protein